MWYNKNYDTFIIDEGLNDETKKNTQIIKCGGNQLRDHNRNDRLYAKKQIIGISVCLLYEREIWN